MKHFKLLSVFMALLIAFSVISTASVYADEADVVNTADTSANENEEIKKFEEILHSCGYNPDFCEKFGKVNDVYVYKAGARMFTELYYSKTVGNYFFTSYEQQPCYDIGIYIIRDDRAYTLEKAYNEGVIDDGCMTDIMGFTGLFGDGWDAIELTKERRAFLKKLREFNPDGVYTTSVIKNLKELGKINGNNGIGSTVVYSNYYKSNITCYSTFNDWLLTHPYYGFSQEDGIFIFHYFGEEPDVYTLEEAVKSGLIEDKEVLNAVNLTNGDVTARKLSGNEKSYVDYLVKNDKFTTRVYEYKELGKVGEYTLVLGRTDNDPNNTGLPSKTVEYAGSYIFENKESYGEELYLIKGSNVLTIERAYESGISIAEVKRVYEKSGDTRFTITGYDYGEDSNTETTQPNTQPTSQTQPTTGETQPTTDAVTPPVNNYEDKAEHTKPEILADKNRLKAGDTCKVIVKGAKVKGWKSSNKKVATVKNGKVTALKKGTANITAFITDGTKLSCKITVKSDVKIKIDKKKFVKSKTYTVKKGKVLNVKITGKAQSVKNRYRTSDKKTAKVISKANAKSIKIKGLKKGSAKITVYVNGAAFKIKVKVKNK